MGFPLVVTQIKILIRMHGDEGADLSHGRLFLRGWRSGTKKSLLVNQNIHIPCMVQKWCSQSEPASQG